MSVLVGLRSESSIQYLETARKLQKYTIQQTIKMPKRYIDVVVTEILRFSQQIYDDVQAANTYPETKEEFKARTAYLKRALLNLRRLASQLDLAYELTTNPENREKNDKILTGYAALIAEEIRLIHGVMKKDEEQFASLI